MHRVRNAAHGRPGRRRAVKCGAEGELRSASAGLRDLRSDVCGGAGWAAVAAGVGIGAGRASGISGPQYSGGYQWSREHAAAGGEDGWQNDSVRGADAGVVGFLVSILLQTGGDLCAAAAVCDVVRDDLLLVLAGAERGGGEAIRRGEGRPAAVGVAACV